MQLLVLALVMACSESPKLPEPEWKTYGFASACVSPIWGLSSSELWVGGYEFGLEEPKSHIWRFDGAAWHEQLVSETRYLIVDLWGFAGGDVFAVGYRGSFGEDPWPAIFRYDGAAWNEMELPAEPGYLTAVWGTSPTHVIAAFIVLNSHALFWRFDGSAWTPMAAQLPDDERIVINGIWGSSATDVHAVGERIVDSYWVGFTAHFNGESWSYTDTPGGEWPVGIWGIGPSTIFVVGWNGLIMMHDGDGWSAMDSGTDRSLFAVWGRAADDVYAVGEGEGEILTVLRYDGEAWSPLPVECSECTEHTRHATSAVWGTAAGDLFLAGRFLPSGVPHCLGSFVMHQPAI
jgi:hypothetical protein